MISTKIYRAFSNFDFLSRPFEKLPRLGILYKNHEAIRLFRRVIKTTRRIYWNDENGLSWAQQIIYSARSEIEYSKTEKDPYVIGQLLLNGHKALEDLNSKLNDLEFKMQKQFSGTSLEDLKKKRDAPYIIPKFNKMQAEYHKQNEKKTSKLILP